MTVRVIEAAWEKQPTVEKMILTVREYATAHYDEGGWDYIVECWSDEDIAQILAEEQCHSLKQAVKTIQSIVQVMDDRRREVMAEVF
jgi:hypothetical protein